MVRTGMKIYWETDPSIPMPTITKNSIFKFYRTLTTSTPLKNKKYK